MTQEQIQVGDDLEYYLCECTNCGSVLIDKNPQTDAKRIKLTGNELEMELLPERKSFFYGCPKCKTDEYLIDLPKNQ